MTDADRDPADEIASLRKEVAILRREVQEIRDFSKYLYMILTEEGAYQPEDPQSIDPGRMNT